MTRFRFKLPPLDWTGPRDPLYQAVLAFAFGALMGLVFWMDQKYAGGYEAYEAVTNFTPIRGFWWNVLGTGVLALLFWGVCRIAIALNPYQAHDVDVTHAEHCAHRSLRVQRRGRLICTCRTRTRPPLRLIGGGRD